MTDEQFCLDCECQPCDCRNKYAASGAIGIAGLILALAVLVDYLT